MSKGRAYGAPLKFASGRRTDEAGERIIAELGEILEHALRGALSDDEAVEHVDVGPEPPRTAVISCVVSVSAPVTWTNSTCAPPRALKSSTICWKALMSVPAVWLVQKTTSPPADSPVVVAAPPAAVVPVPPAAVVPVPPAAVVAVPPAAVVAVPPAAVVSAESEGPQATTNKANTARNAQTVRFFFDT